MTEIQRIVIAVVCMLSWLLWVVFLVLRHRRQREAIHRQPQSPGFGQILIAYASQSGTAATLARQSADHLRAVQPVTMLPLSQVSSQTLRTTRKALFVVSTYGEGEAPDNGRRFARDFLSGKGSGVPDLSHLSYSVIALGDSTYARFCAFGQQLFDGMARLGASALEPMYRIDAAAEGALGVAQGVASIMPGWFGAQRASAAITSLSKPTVWWRLANRTLLNPGSPGAPLFELTLRAVNDRPGWRAGDIFELQPRQPRQFVVRWLSERELDGNAWIAIDGRGQTLQAWLRDRILPAGDFDREKLLRGDFSDFPQLPSREYSVASSRGEHVLKLIVRQQFGTGGELGLGSGWLTEHCDVGELFSGNLRENAACHTQDHCRPLLLIGAGSGLAGLRAQLSERAGQANAGAVWMVYGERCPHADRPLVEELATWARQGTLTRCDRVFSRGNDPERGYVQDFLFAHQEELMTFVSGGGDIYVCGDRAGMGQGVHRMLTQVLGAGTLDALLDSGRYRRDQY